MKKPRKTGSTSKARPAVKKQAKGAAKKGAARTSKRAAAKKGAAKRRPAVATKKAATKKAATKKAAAKKGATKKSAAKKRPAVAKKRSAVAKKRVAAKKPTAVTRKPPRKAAAPAVVVVSTGGAEVPVIPPPLPRRHTTEFYEHARESARERADDGNAFVPDPGSDEAHTDDDLAEEMAEDYVTSALTGGEDTAVEERDEVVDEEEGGPFVETSARKEFAGGTDPANPPDAEQEAFPTTHSPRDEN